MRSNKKEAKKARVGVVGKAQICAGRKTFDVLNEETFWGDCSLPHDKWRLTKAADIWIANNWGKCGRCHNFYAAWFSKNLSIMPFWKFRYMQGVITFFLQLCFGKKSGKFKGNFWVRHFQKHYNSETCSNWILWSSKFFSFWNDFCLQKAADFDIIWPSFACSDRNVRIVLLKSNLVLF